MPADRILVVDDDPDILKILKDNLELDGYEVATASAGKEALHSFETFEPALLVLDLGLPDIDGIQVCRAVRQKSDVPIIMLTARDRVADKVVGLECGADDYLVKPFDYLELAARIKVCLRRRGACSDLPATIEAGNLRIDMNKNAVSKGGERIDLTLREFNILVLLVRNSGKALSRMDIRQAIWQSGDLYKDSRAIDVHIQHLRAKLEANPHDPTYIITVPGVGYLFSLPAQRDERQTQ